MESEIGRDRLLEKRLQKQIGCVTGFFQIFGRQHALNGKRLHRPPVVDYSSELDRSVQSSSISMDFDDLNGKSLSLSPVSIKSSGTKRCPQTPEASTTPAITTPVKTPPSVCGYEIREMSRSTWKFRESPRLSLDSRATAYGSHLPTADDHGVENQRRSTSVIARLMGLETLPESESSPRKTNPDQLTRSASESRVYPSRLIEGFDSRQRKSNITKTEAAKSSNCEILDNVVTKKMMMTTEQKKKPQQRRILSYESGDVYPDETQRLSSYGEVERKLKTRGVNIDEPLMDLDTLKLLLEALQLKGLLRKTEQVVKVKDSKPRKPNLVGTRNRATPMKAEERRRDPPTRAERSRSPRKIKPVVKTGTTLEVSSMSSEAAFSEAESVNNVDKDHKRSSVLERCDLLLHSIAEFNSMQKLHQQESQPSPVSVLDSSFYNDDSSSSPPPVMKRILVFTDGVEVEEGVFENEPRTTRPIYDDPDFIYISEILRLTKSLLTESDIFTYLKEQHRTKNINTDSHRKLVFDIATQLIKKHTQLQEWHPVSLSNPHPLTLVWSEFKKLRDQETEDEDMIDQIRRLLGKDISNDLWLAHHVEMKETVVDVERLIFRDLIEDTIRDLGRKSALASSQPPLRKRLVF
ncbi:hypothetical protein QQ045_002971 [Rhodiola kirilowii]